MKVHRYTDEGVPQTEENRELAEHALCPSPLPFPEPVGVLGHRVNYFTASSAEEVGVKSDHQNRLLYAKYYAFFPISTALVSCRWPAELTLIDSDAEHHLGISFIGFNEQRSAVGWQHVVVIHSSKQYSRWRHCRQTHGARTSGIAGAE